eukprot:TRINITY_DN115274_c0_g1_i1.p2 TRINITY_DN115274_c0_g1~~TRINITY_DN115274_c0_g1_i1.p2  ORF type:complete len:109 (-),score=28.24 TRINITY_DN115274_c0_g1_i1:335-661(-)
MAAKPAAAKLEGPIADRLYELRSGKVEVLLKAIGSTPALKQPRLTIDASKRLADLTTYLKNALKTEDLYVYCADAFEPSNDDYIGDLFRCFAVGSRLSLSYSSTPAFG